MLKLPPSGSGWSPAAKRILTHFRPKFAPFRGFGSATPKVRHSEGIVQSAFTGIKTDSANKRYLFNVIPDTNHNANPTNPNRYSKGNPSEWRTFGMADRYRVPNAAYCSVREDKLCPPSLSKSSFAPSNSSLGTQKRVV